MESTVFGRNFYPTVHTHLHGGNEREMLPWLKLSADLDPHELDAYLTASYWLRTSLHKPDEAEQFLREGLRANPDSYQILLELGRIYFYNRNQCVRGQEHFPAGPAKVAQAGRRRGQTGPRMPTRKSSGKSSGVDRAQGNLKQQLADMEELVAVARSKETLQRQIDDLKGQAGSAQEVAFQPLDAENRLTCICCCSNF